MDFEWDSLKALRNKTKHGVSFAEASEVFDDHFSSCVSDPDHSFDEQRFLIFGKTRQNKYLAVSFTDRHDKIRLISARQMTPRERKAYEQR